MTASGEYELQTDLFIAANEPPLGITVKAADVIINLNGFTLANNDLNSTGSGVGITALADNVSVRNGTISGFQLAVELAASQCKVQDLTLPGNRSMIRLMQYLHTAGLQVPRDIAVVGFDDFEWADYFHPRLTVIAQPIEAIAKRAISLLAARIEDPEVKPQTLHIKPKLIVRESCGSADSRIPKRREKARKQ
jgi:Periplasmic binding protein-like domain